ncbi:MAG: hypothetical protein A2X25_08250 [Chloroflexi bacterium GWB2_49_20]|nr:MAG: hypothetical protein A2X25_08250 [Chloroflexi bacterium GWB2_49_20]OGN79572.1 MAG: hypothetical protein A2X26_05775 [Chloroflexi bacterium GWC2_49_37]OGN84505.1 MAG: hypothetical protein A2X27_10755 [Chloroflexi bacterium GWD2_49_16]
METSTPVSPSPSPSKTYLPSETPLPPAATITPEPLPGLTLWQVNIRSGPGIYFTLLGQINQNQPVQITGVDASGEWFAIAYPSGPEGRGWVTAEYIQATGTDSLPTLGLITLPNGTPAPQASLTQKLNVRSGPGTHFDSLGILPANAIVWLTGRNESGSWLLIDYPSAPGGKGWIIAGYVQAQDILNLPAVDSSGTPVVDIPASEPTMILSTPTLTIAPAFQDGDSADDPGASQVFSPLGIRSFSFTSDLSAPDGDLVDWIAIRPYTSQAGMQASLSASLTCAGNGSLQVQLWQGDQQLSNWGSLTCGNSNNQLVLNGGSDYLFRLSINDGNGLRYILYAFTLRSIP